MCLKTPLPVMMSLGSWQVLPSLRNRHQLNLLVTLSVRKRPWDHSLIQHWTPC